MRTIQVSEKLGLTTYASLSEAVALYNQPKDDSPLNCEENRSLIGRVHPSAKKSWLGCDGGYEKVAEYIQSGWNAGAKKMRDKLAQTEAPKCTSIKRQRRRGADGDDIDIQRVWGGDLENAWERMEKVFQPGPRRVRLVVNIGASCGTDSETMFWRGATCLRLTETLQEAGYAVQIDVGFHQSHWASGQAHETHIPIMSYGETMSIPHLAATVALAGFYRTIGFGCIIRDVHAKIDSGLGGPRPLTQVSQDSGELCITIEQGVSDLRSANEEVARVIALLN